MNIAVIGYGNWGPNLVRNFKTTSGVKVKYIYDLDNSKTKKILKDYPDLLLVENYHKILEDVEISAVIIASQACSHYKLTKQALLANKHVLVEKPLTKTIQEAEELIAIAERRSLVLMVDHVSVYIGAVIKLRELIHSGELGNILYFSSIRINLGQFQKDVNVVWDLAPHDLSILKYILPNKPISVSAVGAKHFNSLEDISYINIFFENEMLAHCHVNWLSPIKVRTILIGADQKMVVYNDLEKENKLTIYDKGISINKKNEYSYRGGNKYNIDIDTSEPLQKVCIHFIDCIKNKKKPLTDGKYGLDIVKIIIAIQESIHQKGATIKIDL